MSQAKNAFAALLAEYDAKPTNKPAADSVPAEQEKTGTQSKASAAFQALVNEYSPNSAPAVAPSKETAVPVSYAPRNKSRGSAVVRSRIAARSAANKERMEEKGIGRAQSLISNVGRNTLGGVEGVGAMALNTAKDLDKSVTTQRNETLLADYMEIAATARRNIEMMLADGDYSESELSSQRNILADAEEKISLLNKAGSHTEHIFDKPIETLTEGAKENVLKAAQHAEDAKAGLGAVGSVGMDAALMLGNMAPAMAVSAIGTPAAGAAFLGATSGGRAYTEKLLDGSDEKKARAYGAIIGTLEGGLQYLTGGISKLAGKRSLASNLDGKIAAMRSGLQKAAAYLALHGVSEIGEEEAQLFLEPLVNSIIYGVHYEAPKIEEIAYTALITALSTGVLEAPNALSFGSTPSIEAGAPQNTPPNAVASRTEIGEGNLPSATQNAPQAQETAKTGDAFTAAVRQQYAPQTENAQTPFVQAGLDAIRHGNRPSNSVVDAIAKDTASLAELGIDRSGKTASQLRAEVRVRLNVFANEKGVYDPSVSQERSPDVMTSEAHRLFGSQETSTPQSVENENTFDAPTEQAYTENDDSNLQGGVVNGAVSQLHGDAGERTLGGVPRARGYGRSVTQGRIDGQGDLRSAFSVLTLGSVQQEQGGESFSKALSEARESDAENGWAVTPKDATELSKTTMLVRPDMSAGLAVAEDGDIEAVFRNQKGARGALLELLPAAIEAGGTKLDCYGIGLVRLYERFGFKPVCRVEFNPEYANPGWDESKGKPYIYFMVATDTDAQSVRSNVGSYHKSTSDELNNLPTFGKNDYDAAYAYRDGLLKKQQSAQSAPRIDSVGAASADFETPGSVSVERTSNLADKSLRYTRARGEASARTQEEYRELFKYLSRTEEQSLHAAETMLYYEMDGERRFLADIDAEAFSELLAALEAEQVWGGIETDAAQLIEGEFLRRSRDGEISDDEYVNWLKVMQTHATEAGRAVQAFSKWTRSDNRRGAATRLEAAEALENSNLSEEERSARFHAIINFDSRIEQARTAEELRGIILDIAAERGTINGITGKQSRLLRSISESALNSLSDGELRQLAYASSAAIASDRTGVNAGQKLKTIQILNMLSNPKTGITNFSGNTAMYGIDALAMRGAALVDMLVSPITGTRSVAMQKVGFDARARESISHAVKLSLAEITMDVDMGGGNRYEHSRKQSFKADGAGVFNTGTAVDRFAERVLHALERNLNYVLTTSDEAFKGAARSTRAGTQALVDKGKIKNAGENYAAEQAEQLARYRTFQDDTKLTAFMTALHDILNFVGIGNSGKTLKGLDVKDFGLGDLAAPFIRVGTNLVKTGADYSPIGIVKGTAEIVKTVVDRVRGGVNPAQQARGVSDIARGVTGTTLALGIAALAKAGVIQRADDEDDEDIANLNKSEGMTGTQINVDAMERYLNGEGAAWRSGDTLLDVSRFEPFSFIANLGVALADNETDGVLSTVKEVGVDSAVSIGQAAADMPVLSTAGDFAEDVFKYGNPAGIAAVEALGKTVVSSVTPNVVAAAAKGFDSKQRNVYAGDTVGDVLIDTLLSRIPGARGTLPTTVNTLGEEKDNPGTLATRILNAMINPVGVNEYTQSEVSREMERVRKETGEKGFYPSTKKPSEVSYTDDKGEKHSISLDYEQKQKYQATYSSTQMAYTSSMIQTSAYKRASDKEKVALLDRCRDFAGQMARISVLGDEAADAWVLHARDAKSELGISPSEYLAYCEKYGTAMMSGSGFAKMQRMLGAGLTVDEWQKMRVGVDTDNSGSTTKAEVTAYITANFPKERRAEVFDAYNGKQNWKNPY